MTSNLGSDIIYKNNLGFREEKEDEAIAEVDMQQKVLSSLKENFKPEFLNRMDELIIFHPISRQMLRQIVDLQLVQIEKRLAEKNIKIKLTAHAKEWLSEKGYDTTYGARPLKRLIQTEIMNELARMIIENKIIAGNTLKIDAKSGKLTFEIA
jgi:ATP-dependent Clp protease ATP-binding subunit ClpA